MLEIDWRPDETQAVGLVISTTMASAAQLKRFATRRDAPAVLRIRDGAGREVVTTPDAVLRWADDAALPEGGAEWATMPVDRGDGAHAIELLDAFLAWSRSRGLIDQTTSQRISLSVQMELSGEARGTPD